MNISLSYNWLKEFVPTTLTPEEFASRLSIHGPSVERVRREHDDLDGMVIGRVVDVRTHPNADKLRLASVDAGKEIVDVVCGGSNLAPGMKVAFARIGARVRWHGEGELVELKPAEIRGVKSFGMICAANEIGLYDLYPHAEREVMDLSSVAATPGTPLAAALGLDDAILDIEVTTNRVDAFSVVGIAREAAAILGIQFSVILRVLGGGSRKEGKRGPPPGMRGTTGVSVVVQSKSLCPRYQAAVVRGVRVGQSPAWMKQRLLASGIRPINAAVDVANYVMIEQGHPLHVFDASKFARGMIIVREARAGEELAALDGKKYALTPGMMVIADAERPVAIAGVLGGEESGVTSATTDIVIESAAFDPVSVRKTSRALGIVSDAALRFEKGIHPESTAAALARATALLVEVCGGAADQAVVDVRSDRWKPRVIAYHPQAASALAGVVLDAKMQRRSLEALGFAVKPAGKTWKVTIPWWRDADIEEGERDLIEEVTRLYGYNRITATLPAGNSARSHVFEFDRIGEIQEFFRGAGFYETQTLPLVPDSWAPDGLALENPLTSDAVRMRTSLLPSLLDAAACNQEESDALQLFEISRVYLPRAGEIPDEPMKIVAVATSAGTAGDAFFALKGVLEALGHRFSIFFELSAADYGILDKDKDLLHPGRRVAICVGGKEIGTLGEVNPFVAKKRFGLERRTSVLSLDLAAAFRAQTKRAIRDLPAFPAVKRDISFVVPERTKHADIIAVIDAVAASIPLPEGEGRRVRGNLSVSAILFDVFTGKDVPLGKKSMAYHLAFQSDERTLTADEVEKLEQDLKKKLETKFGAEMRS